MAAYIFQTIANKGSAQGISSNATKEARDWYRDAAQKVTNVSAPRLLTDRANIKAKITQQDIGKMYMFFYDALHKDTLPYFDMFPLIFIIGFKEDGFLGINLHYISPLLRARLMDALYTTANNNKYDNTTKLKISYQLLNKASKFKYFSPCVKHYLWSQVVGQYLNVEVQNWDIALMLPTERFAGRGVTKQKVWAESAKKV